jgi:hypothetical protein
MYIYKIYNSRKEIEQDYKSKKLKKDYIFAYDRRLYIVIESNFTFYKPLNPVVFKNELERDHIVKMCNLLWYESDIVILNNKGVDDICKYCSSLCN